MSELEHKAGATDRPEQADAAQGNQGEPQPTTPGTTVETDGPTKVEVNPESPPDVAPVTPEPDIQTDNNQDDGA